MKYIYRREDDGTTVEVDWETMMGQQGGYITLSDGVIARRCVYLEQDGKPLETAAKQSLAAPPVVSDTLGCGMHQVEQLREDARANGYRVEFTPDSSCPEFYQARLPTENEKWRYARHRGMFDKNSRNGGGVALTGQQLERAAARLLEQAQASS